MFAVPGWSVSASSLRPQIDGKTRSAANGSLTKVQTEKSESKSKKRKRPAAKKVNNVDVNSRNVAELWQKYIERREEQSDHDGRATSTKGHRKRRRRKEESKNVEQDGKTSLKVDGEVSISNDREPNSNSQIYTKGSCEPKKTLSQDPGSFQTGKLKYEARKAKTAQKAYLKATGTLSPSRSHNPAFGHTKTSAKPSHLPEETPLIPSPPPPAPSNLTPLQTAMRAKLISARFRHLNQTLYTTSSTHASMLFSTSPEAYSSYHAGFRAQVSGWPQNPVELFVRDIKQRGTAKGPKSQKQLFHEEKRKKKGKGGKKKEDEEGKGEEEEEEEAEKGKEGKEDAVNMEPLPRTNTTATILDLGCGDATLHASLLPLSSPSRLNLHLHSFDLSPGDGPNAHLIQIADIAHLPLQDGEADLAIFCLALMGTNWVDFVTEAARVLRMGGECWVAEVRSRFVGSEAARKMVEAAREKHWSGKVKGNGKGKKRGKGEEEDGAAMAEVEEEAIGGKGAGKGKGLDTDVKPFVEVFRRRGFVLKGEVDGGNKMFVRMRFVRVKDPPRALGGRGENGKRFLDKDDRTVGMVMEPEEEARVLKPCVYKIR